MIRTDFLNNLVVLLDGGKVGVVLNAKPLLREAFVKEPPWSADLHLKLHPIIRHCNIVGIGGEVGDKQIHKDHLMKVTLDGEKAPGKDTVGKRLAFERSNGGTD